MIHFTCDCCQRPIDQEQESRYVVRVEVYSAVEAEGAEGCDERDHLQEIDDLLERMDELDGEDIAGEVYQQVRYDLCSTCREIFLKNPLGRLAMNKLGFSDN